MALSCIEAPLGTFSSVEIEFFLKSTFTLSQIEIQNYSNPILNLDQNSTSCHLNERGLFPWISAWQVIPNFGQNYSWYTIIFSFFTVHMSDQDRISSYNNHININ